MKLKRLLLLFVFVALPSFAAYQQQGFSEYQEVGNSINFVCQQQCVLLLGPNAGSDYLSLYGTFQGTGMIGYGFLVGDQVAQGDALQLSQNGFLDHKFSLKSSPYYNQVPSTAQIVLIFQGAIQGVQVEPHLSSLSFFEKIGEGLRDFWHMETLTPYSINLRYGVKVLGTSILHYGYWVFLLISLYILFFVKGNKEQKYRRIFFLGIGIFLFIGIRNFITYTWIVDQGIKTYVHQSYENKTFFDLGDYITFTDQIRKKLKLDEGKQNCKIYVDSYQDWPFKSHWEFLYLKPCLVTLTGSEADYIISYHKPLTGNDTNKSILLQFNGSYLLKNK